MKYSDQSLTQEIRLLRICLSLNALGSLVFMTIAWLYLKAENYLYMYIILGVTVFYSWLLYRWINLKNYRWGALIFLSLLTGIDTMAFLILPPENLAVVFLLVFTFVIIFNVLLISWPEVIMTNGLLLIWGILFVLWPATGFQASAQMLVGVGSKVFSTAVIIYYALILVLGTGIIEVKRRTERQLLYMNENLNRLVDEKVAEIQRADQEKRQIQEQLEIILRNSPMGVVLIDEQMNFIYTNGVHFRFNVHEHGVEEEPGTIFPLNVLKEFILQPKAPAILAQEKALIGQRLEYLAPDGSKVILRYSFICVKLHTDKNEKVKRLVLMTEDITQEELLREKLIQADHLAAMGRMAASLAHEVNNPLAGIKLYLDLLEQDLASPEKRKAIFTSLNDSVSRIDRIIKSFLTFARQDKPKKEWLDAQAVLKETLDMTANFKQFHRINITTHFVKDMPFVLADQQSLARVFINLINNARDAMQEGGTLSIQCYHEGGEVVIIFKDNGVGIKQEDLQYLFTPFFTTKERGKGTGLGLSISYGIIKEHGGKLEVESREGIGTTFIIRLPIKERTGTNET